MGWTRRINGRMADGGRGIPGAGRPRLPLSDMVFASVFKMYVGFSNGNFTGDLRGVAYADDLRKANAESMASAVARPMEGIQ